MVRVELNKFVLQIPGKRLALGARFPQRRKLSSALLELLCQVVALRCDRTLARNRELQLRRRALIFARRFELCHFITRLDRLFVGGGGGGEEGLENRIIIKA